MAYDTLERSAADGRPVELYTFARSSLVWRYTSADRDLVVDTQAYSSAVIRRGGLEQGPEPVRAGLKLTVPRDFTIASLYKIAPPSDPITLVLRQYHYGDTGVAVLWQGIIKAVSFSGAEAEIELQPASGSLQRTGLRRCYQRTCPFVLYGPDCSANPAAFRVTAPAAIVSGLEVSVVAAASQSDGYYDGGFLEWLVAPGVYERRFIVSHVGVALTLDVVPLGLSAGTEVRIYPGCDHSLSTCSAKFANALNYGGMPYIPTKNPFGGDPIY